MIKHNPLLSVIVPIYNVEKYLDKCIKSIVQQTYNNLEIILVDDGSPDNCPSICDNWAQIDSRIKVIHKKNGGLSDARNAGMEIARGEYIGFVDSDDYIELDMYEKLLNKLCESNADLAICNFENVDEIGNITSINRCKKNGIISGKEILEEWCLENFIYYVVAWNKLYTRKSLEDIRFPVGKIHEDNFVMYKVFYNCNSVVCMEEKKYYYVQHKGSIMSEKISVRRFDAVQAFYECYNFCQEHNISLGCQRVAERMIIQYFDIKRQLKIFGHNQIDRMRMNEINQMFREIYFKRTNHQDLKSYFKFFFPKSYFFISKNKNRIRTFVQLLKYAIMKNQNTILIDTPTHGNLGDHAIVMAEQQLLSEYGIKSYELTANRINYHEKLYAKLTPMNQYILVHGGGFLGALWPEEEERFRRILQTFQKQKIVVFPQTVTFDISTEVGKKYLKQSQEIYSAHPDLTIFVREKKSYAFMKEYFPKVKCFLVPDIVTIMNSGIIKAEKRSGVLFCMRADTEKSIAQEELKSIEISVKNAIPEENIEYTDTVLDHMILPENRQREVTKKLKEFSEAKLIVTDRLHGMIFAALTNTPCIALSNSNGKVQAVYEWIKENEYIIFADDIEQIPNILQNLDLNKNYTYDRKQVQSSFSDLISMLEKINSNEK